jgi:hypothetical protein
MAMAAAITKAITKTMPIQDTMTMNMNMEDLLVVTVVVVTVVMLMIIVANSKMKELAMLMITTHAAGMIVVAATAINSFAIDLNKRE